MPEKFLSTSLLKALTMLKMPGYLFTVGLGTGLDVASLVPSRLALLVSLTPMQAGQQV